MKPILLFLAFILLFITNVNAQILALNAPPAIEIFSDHPMQNYAPNMRRHKMGPVTVVGISMACVGGLLIPAGFINELGGYQHGMVVDQSAISTGHAMEYGGIAMMIIGIGMSIGGGIDDHAKIRRTRLGVIAPKRNEVGLAYNF